MVCDPVSMSAPVLETVRASGVVTASDRVLALVSGGRDSVCLLDVLVRICSADRVAVLHVDYGLRGAESDADARAVRDLCGALGVRCTVYAAPPSPASGNLQAWARDVRYARAAALAGEALIATGHTASDQAETVLYRLAASPGRRALLGMAMADGRLIRPLLEMTREQTAAYCAERGLGWRDDSSNAGERFARGRVRHGVLGELRRVHPAAEANLLRSVEILRAEAEVLDAVVEVALAGRTRIALERLAALPAALARLVVIELAERVARAPVPAVGARVGELLALGRRGGSAALDVGGGVRAIVEYGVLRFERTSATAAGLEQRLAVPGAVAYGEWDLTCTLERAGGEPLARAGDGVLDAEALGPGALTVRGWRAGDRMRPLGLSGSKTLADLFTDRKVPRAQRGTLPILVREEEIVWVPGIATGERFRVHRGTRRIAVLRATRQ